MYEKVYGTWDHHTLNGVYYTSSGRWGGHIFRTFGVVLLPAIRDPNVYPRGYVYQSTCVNLPGLCLQHDDFLGTRHPDARRCSLREEPLGCHTPYVVCSHVQPTTHKAMGVAKVGGRAWWAFHTKP